MYKRSGKAVPTAINLVTLNSTPPPVSTPNAPGNFIPNNPPPPVVIPKNGSSPALPNRLVRSVFARRHTWRWQSAALCWLVLMAALTALLIALNITTSRIQTFQDIEQIAVPSINAANQAEQSLSAEVSANAAYILSDAASRTPLQITIERNRADFERSLQTGYSALSNYQAVQPPVDTAFDYLNQHNQALQDAFAQSRKLSDAGDRNGAVTAYLEGQNSYYKPIIFTIYYLRAIYINQLDEAKTAATNSSILQFGLAGLLVVCTAGLLLFINLWLTLKVKRVLLPLANLGFLVATAYAVFLLLGIFSSNTQLNKVVAAYNQTSLLSDSQRLITDAASDQTQWLISGKVDASGQFKGDDTYSVDFKTQTSRLLTDATTKAVINTGTNNNSSGSGCPANSADSTGAMAEVCSNLLVDTQTAKWNTFYNAYLAWLADDAHFRQLVNTGKVTEALTALHTTSSKDLNQINTSLSQLKTENEQIYTQQSDAALNVLNLANLLTWPVYLLMLVLTVAGLLQWRRQF